jgi:glycosyltransferase involved in cell wall biosynthesis
MPAIVLKPELQTQFDDFEMCVIVPVYNHGSTVLKVLQDVTRYTTNILVINDGSTDQTRVTLEREAPACCEIIHFAQNQGKGAALRDGFKRALALGYKRAITLDADGQHLASDIGAFVDALAETPNALMIGARDMQQDTVPGGSSFGHKFSNFWYRVITGRKLPDTQSGFRLYPLARMRKWKLFTGKYELEMEVLVRLSWTQIPVIPIPIHVYYPPGRERITHFRKVPDFMRITALSALFVVIGLLFARPIRFFKGLNRERAKALFREHVLGSKDSNQKITFAVMLGLFVGVAPIWGFQIVAVIFFTVLFKLNKVIALAAAHISIPPMIPIIVFASFKLGGFILGKEELAVLAHYRSNIDLAQVKADLSQYVIGSLALGILLAIVVGGIFHLCLMLFRRQRPALPEMEESIIETELHTRER